jgi:uncharacterized protein YqeY
MLYEQVKASRITAMKEKQETRKRILTVLLGEIERSKGSKEITDEVVISAVRKLVKAANDNIVLLAAGHPLAAEAQQDKIVLEEYLPQMMSEENTRALMALLKDKHSGNMGMIMKEAKTVPGVDMAVASKILKNI